MTMESSPPDKATPTFTVLEAVNAFLKAVKRGSSCITSGVECASSCQHFKLEIQDLPLPEIEKLPTLFLLFTCFTPVMVAPFNHT
jgi:hypothetical protein